MRRASEERLHRVFRDVLGAILASSTVSVAVVACGGTAAAPGTTLGAGGPGGTGGTGLDGGVAPVEDESACGPGPYPTLLSGLKADPPIDGAVERFEHDSFGVLPEDPDAWSTSDGEKTGELCARASNKPGCLAKVTGFRVLPGTRERCVGAFGSPYGGGVTCDVSYLLYTRGDEIGVARTKEETRGLIGTVDTLDEAMWIANQAGLERSCGSGNPSTSTYRGSADGGYDMKLVTSTCGQAVQVVTVHIDPGGTVTERSRSDTGQFRGCPVAGRRPTGLSEASLQHASADGGDPAGRQLGAMATLEAASVVAFRRLKRELAAHGAPAALLARLRTAAADEIRHARATGRVARKYGVEPRAAEIAGAGAPPSLFALALENAREGCVRETFGALVAHHQAACAGDADVRACMRAIAVEETQHAALSWDIAEWIDARLDDDQRAAVDAERRAAFRWLAGELAIPLDARAAATCGLPTARDALKMLDGLAPTLLAA